MHGRLQRQLALGPGQVVLGAGELGALLLVFEAHQHRALRDPVAFLDEHLAHQPGGAREHLDIVLGLEVGREAQHVLDGTGGQGDDLDRDRIVDASVLARDVDYLTAAAACEQRGESYGDQARGGALEHGNLPLVRHHESQAILLHALRARASAASGQDPAASGGAERARAASGLSDRGAGCADLCPRPCCPASRRR